MNVAQRVDSISIAFYNLYVIMGETIDKASSGTRPLLLPRWKLLAQMALEGGINSW